MGTRKGNGKVSETVIRLVALEHGLRDLRTELRAGFTGLGGKFDEEIALMKAFIEKAEAILALKTDLDDLKGRVSRLEQRP